MPEIRGMKKLVGISSRVENDRAKDKSHRKFKLFEVTHLHGYIWFTLLLLLQGDYIMKNLQKCLPHQLSHKHPQKLKRHALKLHLNQTIHEHAQRMAGLVDPCSKLCHSSPMRQWYLSLSPSLTIS